MPRKSVLLVEDEPNVLRVIKAYFEKDGYTVYTAVNGQDALAVFNTQPVDVVCLDVMMPKLNGWNVAKTIREQSDVYIIMVTALESEDDILKGYHLHVDDYVIKPFSPSVLLAKANRLLERKSVQKEKIKTALLEAGGITLDLSAHIAYVDQKPLSLSRTEFSLLSFFIRHKNQACSRERLLDEVWGYDVYVEDRIVDTYVKHLRKHIQPYTYIKTVFGIGYRFEVDSDV